MSEDGGREKAVLLDYLAGQRRHVLGILEGLSDDDLRRAVLPSGWSPLGLVHHLTVGRRAVLVRGRRRRRRHGHRRAGPDRRRRLDGPRRRHRRRRPRRVPPHARGSDDVVAAADLDAPPAWWPTDLFGDAHVDDVREVLVHVIAETACHAGHLDAAREIADGRQWMVLPADDLTWRLAQAHWAGASPPTVVTTGLAVVLTLPALLAGCASSGADATAGSATTSPSAATTTTPPPTPTPAPRHGRLQPPRRRRPLPRSRRPWSSRRSPTHSGRGWWRPACGARAARSAGRAAARGAAVRRASTAHPPRRARGERRRREQRGADLPELYRHRFPIRRMTPVEAYGGDDNASMAADNTSAFNCRQPGQANAPSATLPARQRPRGRPGPVREPVGGPALPLLPAGLDLRDAPQRGGRRRQGRRRHGGRSRHEGWIWQDSTTTDYQHFDTGYPSRRSAVTRLSR